MVEIKETKKCKLFILTFKIEGHLIKLTYGNA